MGLGLAQLAAHYLRLKQELEAAYEARPWPSEHIDRLADEIAATELRLARMTHGLQRRARSTVYADRRHLPRATPAVA